MKRRDFIKALPLGVAAVGVPFSLGGFAGRAFGRSPVLDSILNGSDGSDRVLVLINLAGGNDGLNTVIPFTDPVYAKARPTIGFGPASHATLSTTNLSTSIARQDLALNPAMAMRAGTTQSMFELFSTKKLAIVNNVGYPSPSLSHFRSTDIWNTASDSNVVLTTGWLGRYLEEAVDTNYPTDVKTGDDPLAITIGGAPSAAFQGTTFGMGIAVLDPSNYLTAGAPQAESTASTNAGAELAYVRGIYQQSDIYANQFTKYFTKGQTPKNTVNYPSTNIAQQLQRVAWCIAAGMKTKVYFVQLAGFDTHISQNATDPSVSGQAQLLMQLSQAIGAFQTDMENAGMADRVIGMTYSEFGRRVNENGSNGTDHGTSAPQFLFGTQINGEVYSSHPNLTDLDSNADLKWAVDFRQLYTSVLGDWFGVSPQMRKAILMDKTTSGEQFAFNIPVNGTSTVQSLIKTPAVRSVSSAPQPLDFVLNPNYPNPFTSSTTVSFALARTMPVKLEVYSERGERVAELANATLGRGTHEFVFGANGLANGTYICRLEAGDGVLVRQMTVVR